jgi:nucleoside-diphosphate-sugar epimerase
MKILIVGGGGMLGQKLVSSLARIKSIGEKQITQITLADANSTILVPPTDRIDITTLLFDITNPSECEILIARKPDLIFHLAAVVSGEAELNLEKGYSVNLFGTFNLFEAIRKESIKTNYYPKLVFASSVAVYGGPYLEVIDDHYGLQPRTSYGTQKAMGELLLNDYSRRNFLDGIGIRLPTISVRPGLPNKAASGLFSNIVREPLMGIDATLPVSKEITNFFASPKSAVDFLVRAANLDTSLLNNQRNLMMPGVHASVGEIIAALSRVAGSEILRFIKEEYDEVAEAMVSNWNFPPISSDRARSLGFESENSFDEIIQRHIMDELNGIIPGAVN